MNSDQKVQARTRQRSSIKCVLMKIGLYSTEVKPAASGIELILQACCESSIGLELRRQNEVICRSC